MGCGVLVAVVSVPAVVLAGGGVLATAGNGKGKKGKNKIKKHTNPKYYISTP